MKLRSYVRNARRHLAGALVITLVAGVLGALASIALSRTMYVSSATVTLRPVGLVQGDPAGQTALSQLTAGIPILISSQRVLAPAGDSLDPKVPGTDLAKAVVVRAPGQSLVFTAQVTTASRIRAEETMKAVVEQFDKAVAEGALQGGPGDLRLEVASKAINTDEAPGSSLGRMSTVAVAVLAGLLFGLLYLLSRVALDDSVSSAADLAEVTDDSVVAVLSSPDDMDGIRALAGRLDYLIPGPGGRTLALASVAGASASAAQVARSLTDAVPHSVLVDLDLRARPLGEATPGVAEFLAGLALQVEGPVVPAGGPVPNPGELLGREALAGLLSDLATHHRWVVAAAGPLVDTSDGLLAARRVDALLAVVDLGRTRRSQVQEALNVLRAGGGHLAGFVLVGKKG